jgi:malonate decarboxylase gamma subunit
MTLDEILTSLFGTTGGIQKDRALLKGHMPVQNGPAIHVLGLANGSDLGVDDAITLSRQVLQICDGTDQDPLLFLVDSSSQRMSRRDELLGLNEYLAHLAKSLFLASRAGHHTIGLLYGGSAAGPFIATALACETLVALPGAHPAVMDLPSMARVTKLSLDVLKGKAEETPVFAPGLDNLAQTGAIHKVWDPAAPLAPQLIASLGAITDDDRRGELGKKRGGRFKAAAIADRVLGLAEQHARG